jgi:uncharacterized membrane protein
MNAFTSLLAQRPLIFVHLVCALGTLVLGAVMLARRKGTSSHRATGYAWVVLMAGVVLTSAFIRDRGMPNIAGYTPIHLLTLGVALMLPRAVFYARAGNVTAHRQAMRGLYIGGCIVAGLFTLLPGRFLGRWLWPQVGALLA